MGIANKICSTSCENWSGVVLHYILCTSFIKNSILALRKWKIISLYKKVEKSIWQHCLECQDTHLCLIWAHYHELCHGYGGCHGHLA